MFGKKKTNVKIVAQSTSGNTHSSTTTMSTTTSRIQTEVRSYSEQHSSTITTSSLNAQSIHPRTIFDVSNNVNRTINLSTANPSTSIGYQSPFNRRLEPLTRSSSLSVPIQSVQADAKVWKKPGTPISSSLTNQSYFTRTNPNYRSDRLLQTRSSIEPPVNNLSSTENSRLRSYSTPAFPVPYYIVKGNKMLLIINNIKFLNKEDERKGAEKDESKLKETFGAMNFNITSHTNLKTNDMLKEVKDFRKKITQKKADLMVIIIMSHGHNRDGTKIVKGGYSKIVGTDGDGLEVDDILNEFTADKCPAMSGKPKIFIFQCCRGDNYEMIHVDAVPFTQRPKVHSDMLLAFSTLPGFFSFRNPKTGSWYIQSLCEVFQLRAKNWHIETMLKEIDMKLGQQHPQYAQTSTYESRGFNKECYLVDRPNCL